MARVLASDAFARLVSVFLTSLLVLAVLYWLIGAVERPPVLRDRVIEAVFLTPLPSPSPAAPATATATVTAPRRADVPTAAAPPLQSTPSVPVTPASPDIAPGLDYGSLLGDGAHAEFADRLPGQRDAYRTPFQAPPERFRMRRRMTPEDVVRGFAQLVGLWPPGYTDSPCPAIRRLIETTPGTPSQRELDLLQDAVLARERFCL